MNKKIRLVVLFATVFSACTSEADYTAQEEQIVQYITKNSLEVTEKTESGLRYIKLRPGTGSQLSAGQTVAVNYRGTLLSGKEFDAGTFDFKLLTGSVVRGFDQGIAKMSIGEKAILIFPSSLGYGSRSSGPIPANSPLLFEIEVLSAQ